MKHFEQNAAFLDNLNFNIRNLYENQTNIGPKSSQSDSIEYLFSTANDMGGIYILNTQDAHVKLP